MGDLDFITIALDRDDVAALSRLRDELFPRSSITAVAQKCLRDELVRCGLRPSGNRHRSRGARKSAPHRYGNSHSGTTTEA